MSGHGPILLTCAGNMDLSSLSTGYVMTSVVLWKVHHVEMEHVWTTRMKET